MVSGFLLRGLLSGIFAGLLAASFAFCAGEPSIERAIAFEGTASQATGDSHEPEIVSRSVQRSVGLFTASTVFGAAVGGLFSLVFALAYGRLGDFSPRTLAALLAFLGFVTLVLVPELKYPANPPTIGAADTIGQRTELYFALLTISFLTMIFVVTLVPPLAARIGIWNGVLVSAAVFIVVTSFAASALPPVDEIPSGFPASALWYFRLASIGTRAVLWLVLGLAFGGMAQSWMKRMNRA